MKNKIRVFINKCSLEKSEVTLFGEPGHVKVLWGCDTIDWIKIYGELRIP